MKFLKKSAIVVMAATIISANGIGCVPMNFGVNPVLTANAADVLDSGDFGAEGSDVKWVLDSEGTLTISGEGVMPEWEYSDSPWYSCDEIIKVVIEKGVKNLPDRAFYSCSGLKEVIISETVENIQVGAFSSLYSLKHINVAENNPYYKSFDGVLFDKDMKTIIAYPAEKDDKVYEIPDTVTVIEEFAFFGVSYLKNVIIPDGVTRIGESAFEYSDITEVKIPASVTTIEKNAFSYASWLTKIEVDEANANYKSVDGVFFDKDMKTLIIYPSSNENTSYTVPNGVITIAPRAFYGNVYLEDVTLSDTVTSINDHAFFASSIKSIVIPDSVTEIGDGAFFGSNDLTSITLPKSVSKIDFCAFASCNSLTLLEIYNPECDIYDFEHTINETATISGYADSTAQAYAEKYEREFVVLGDKPATPAYQLGDVNADGKIDSSDASFVLAEYAIIQTGQEMTFSNEKKLAADVNKDNVVDSSDASKILAYYAAISTGKTPGWD